MTKHVTFDALVRKLSFRAGPWIAEPIDSLFRTAEAYKNSGMRVPSHVLDQLVRRRAEWKKRQDVPAVVRAACATADRNQGVRP